MGVRIGSFWRFSPMLIPWSAISTPVSAPWHCGMVRRRGAGNGIYGLDLLFTL